jgi:TatD DNase family protein
MKSPRRIDIAVNLTDPMYKGLYRDKQVHASDIDLVVQRAANADIGMIITGTSVQESKEALELAIKYQQYSTVGVHPTRCSDLTEETILELAKLAKHDRVVALGECGLDADRLEYCAMDAQIIGFKAQLELSKNMSLPIFFHNRNTKIFYDICKEYRSFYPSGVVHSFDGDLDDVRRIKELDLFIGINGCSLKTGEQLNIVSQIPLDRILVETDAPWCDIRPTHASYNLIQESKSTYETFKKEKFKMGSLVKSRNEPISVISVLEILSKLHDIDVPELEQVILGNTRRLFSRLKI